MTETSHRIPFGGDDMVVAMACSVLELARTTSQHTSTATAAAPRRTASLPLRRVWPSPTGAKAMERHGRFPLPDGRSVLSAGAGGDAGAVADWSVVTGSPLALAGRQLAQHWWVGGPSRCEH